MIELITPTVIVTYVAKKFLDQFLLEEGYGKIRKLFFPTKKYIQELEKVIYSTIEEYEKTNPSNTPPGKFPFYHSQILFSQLIRHTYFKGFTAENLEVKFKQNPNINIPKKAELERFFELFQENVSQNKKLKKLYINENYKAEIFAISESLSKTLSDLDDKVSELLHIQDVEERPNVVTTYLNRNEEDKLYNEINNGNILLLTGVSFCGKSQIAKRLCLKLIDSGFEYRSRSDINDAERFLRPTGNKRVFLLEDPFGHRPDSYSNDDWRKLEELIRNIPNDNKLIVTSRIEVLHSINENTSISELNIDAYEWHDLTITNKSFLISFWHEVTQKKKINNSVKKKIKDYLIEEKSERNLLQVGQLNHLSNIESDKLSDKSTEYLIYIARTDSRRISKEIKKRGNIARKIFISLGLGASTNISINMRELDFVLNETDERPGFIKDEKFRGFTTSDFQSKNDPSNFPKYNIDYKLSNEELMELSFLQERGYIEINNEKILFKHPTYREAARYLFLESDIYNKKITEESTEKLLSSLNPFTSKHCAIQLNFIYNNTVDKELKKTIIELALRSTSESIFPGTRDICFTFLLNRFSILNQDQREYLLRKLELPSTAHQIQWISDIPFIDTSKVNFNTDTLEGFQKADVPKIRNKLRDDEDLSLGELWNFIIHETKSDGLDSLTNNEILKLLEIDESFIRSQISSNIFNKSYPGLNVVKAIFNDEHPSVIFQALKSAILGYHYFSPKEKEELLPFLTQSLSNTYVKVRANNLLSTFGIDYGSESYDWRNISEEQKLQMWDLWAKLFPILLDNYPETLEFSNTGRFYSTLNDSIKFLSPQKGLEISNSFYSWISKFIHSRELDEFELSVMAYLIDITEHEKTIRLNLFKKILSHEDTGFVALSLADSVERWSELTDEEKEYIIDLLDENRSDKRWLKATSLTQNVMPSEIQSMYFGDNKLFQKDPSTIVKSLDSQLLSDCLCIFFGKPQPLWWLGFHHRGRDLWYSIARWILANNYEYGFEVCLKELINDGINNSSSFSSMGGYQTWSYLCQNHNRKIYLSERLIKEIQTTTCDLSSTKKLWDILIKGFEDDGKLIELVDLIVDNISLLHSNRPDDVIKFIDQDFFIKRILPEFRFDDEIISFVLKIKNDAFRSNDDAKISLESILSQNSNSSIQLQITLNALNSIDSENILEMPFLKKLQDVPNDINNYDRIESARMNESDKLENWNYCIR